MSTKKQSSERKEKPIGQVVSRSLDHFVRLHASARMDLMDALEAAYPEGKQVAFMRSSRQSQPSFGVVVGTAVQNFPYLVIRGDSGKRKVSWISLDDVITKPNVTGQGTRHLVAGTLDPLVGISFSFSLHEFQ